MKGTGQHAFGGQFGGQTGPGRASRCGVAKAKVRAQDRCRFVDVWDRWLDGTECLTCASRPQLSSFSSQPPSSPRPDPTLRVGQEPGLCTRSARIEEPYFSWSPT